MGENETEVFTSILNNTDSVIVIVFVLVILFFVIAFIPIYKLILQSRTDIANNENDKMDLTIKREALIIEVITKNTEVISGLKLLFENTLDPSLREMEEKINDLCNKIDELDKRIIVLVQDGKWFFG